MEVVRDRARVHVAWLESLMSRTRAFAAELPPSAEAQEHYSKAAMASRETSSTFSPTKPSKRARWAFNENTSVRTW